MFIEDLAMQAVADHLASSWDGCRYHGVAEDIDIGQAIRAALSRTRNVEHTAQQWDGCLYEVAGGNIDIGDAIRRSYRSMPEPGQTSPAIR